MKTTVILLAAIALIWIVLLIALGKNSRTASVAEFNGTSLSPCGSEPNCVCSDCPNSSKGYIDPIDLRDLDQPISFCREVIQRMGADIVAEETNYLHAAFSSRIFGLVDDFEIRIDNETKLLHIRSQSRVGYSDLGVNKKRAQKFRKLTLESL